VFTGILKFKTEEWKGGLTARERRKSDKTEKRMKPLRISHGISA